MARKLCYRGAVNTWECDEMGHMNVRFYLAKAHQGLAHIAGELGLGPAALEDAGQGLVVRRQHIRFLRELHAGADLSVEGGVVSVGTDGLTIYQEVLPLAHSHVSATLTSEVALLDLAKGGTAPLPDSCRPRVLSLESDIPDHGAPRTLDLSAPIPVKDEAEATEKGHLQVSVQTVRTPQTDSTGHLYPDEFIGFISDGIGNLFGLITKTDDDIYESTDETGGAALEYRFDYTAFPRAGDLVKVLSAPVRVLEKVYVLRHIIVNAETGDVFAQAESVHIAFNLQTRKSIAVPARLRKGLEAHLAR